MSEMHADSHLKNICLDMYFAAILDFDRQVMLFVVENEISCEYKMAN